MYEIRRAADRGSFDHGWLKTSHTFSFGEYQSAEHHHFRTLRVINEDWVAPGQGFGMHPHRDMEIITYVLSGALQHRDSMGNTEILRAGEFQRMSAGSGILHSEFNPSETEQVHLYQIWLMPQSKGIAPSYEQKAFDVSEHPGQLRLVAAPDGTDGVLRINQQARISLGSLPSGKQLQHSLNFGGYAWLQVLRGSLQLSNQLLAAGDGVAISDQQQLELSAVDDAEMMLFELN